MGKRRKLGRPRKYHRESGIPRRKRKTSKRLYMITGTQRNPQIHGYKIVGQKKWHWYKKPHTKFSKKERVVSNKISRKWH